MAKGVYFMIRADEVFKKRIAAAARSRGVTLSKFVLDATAIELARAEKPTGTDSAGGVSRGVPAYLRALLATAASGGAGGYESVGHQFAGCLANQCPDNLSLDEWEGRLDELDAMLRPGLRFRRLPDSAPVIAWFDRHFPRFMAMIPRRRSSNFVEGVRRFLEEGNAFEV